MPAKHPRINLVLEQRLYQAAVELAEQENSCKDAQAGPGQCHLACGPGSINLACGIKNWFEGQALIYQV